MSFLSLLSGLKIIQNGKIITVSGSSFKYLYNAFNKMYGSRLVSNILIKQNRFDFSFHEFYLLDIVFIIKSVITNKRGRSSGCTGLSIKLIILFREQFKLVDDFLSIIENPNFDKEIPKVDKSILSKVFNKEYKLYDYQEQFIDSSLYKTRLLGLKGYLLDAKAGMGKSFCALALAEILKPNHVVIIAPKKSINDVWEDYINVYYKEKQSYSLSLRKVFRNEENELNVNNKFLVTHYESLDKIIPFIMENKNYYKDSVLIIDEGHNFNTEGSNRSTLLRELHSLLKPKFTLWLSGTPFKAMGKEVFTLFSTIDPLFDNDVEKSFFDIYGKNNQMALTILANRIQLIRTELPVQELDTKLFTHVVRVKTKDSNEYTLDSIAKQMKAYVEERTFYYNSRKEEFEKEFIEILEYFELNCKYNKNDYKHYIKVINHFHNVGYDPMFWGGEAIWAKKFEKDVIEPQLGNDDRKRFRKLKSIYKYVELTIVGETLGNVLGKARINCNVSIIKHLLDKKNVTIDWEDGTSTNEDLNNIILSAEAKTIMFTDFVEVVKEAEQLLNKEGFNPITVYGDNNSELNKRVQSFIKNEDINPLVTTFKSLGEAVPLFAANRVIFLNIPFRSYIEEQAVKRAYRIGQTKNVDLFKVLLDTGEAPNVSTRSKDISDWSAKQVAILLGKELTDELNEEVLNNAIEIQLNLFNQFKHVLNKTKNKISTFLDF